MNCRRDKAIAFLMAFCIILLCFFCAPINHPIVEAGNGHSYSPSESDGVICAYFIKSLQEDIRIDISRYEVDVASIKYEDGRCIGEDLYTVEDGSIILKKECFSDLECGIYRLYVDYETVDTEALGIFTSIPIDIVIYEKFFPKDYVSFNVELPATHTFDGKPLELVPVISCEENAKDRISSMQLLYFKKVVDGDDIRWEEVLGVPTEVGEYKVRLIIQFTDYYFVPGIYEDESWIFTIVENTPPKDDPTEKHPEEGPTEKPTVEDPTFSKPSSESQDTEGSHGQGNAILLQAQTSPTIKVGPQDVPMADAKGKDDVRESTTLAEKTHPGDDYDEDETGVTFFIKDDDGTPVDANNEKEDYIILCVSVGILMFVSIVSGVIMWMMYKKMMKK